MPSTVPFSTRIDPVVKEEAQLVLDAMGMTVAQAFRLMMTRIAREKALPFDVPSPSEETIAAMREARAGTNLRRSPNVAALMADLHGEEDEG